MNKQYLVGLLSLLAIDALGFGPTINPTIGGGTPGGTNVSVGFAGVSTNVVNGTTLFPNGTVDSTIAIQNAIYASSYITLQPGDYYTTNTIYLTNNVNIYGYGATIHYATNQPWFALAWNTNVSNVTIKGLSLEGGFTNVAFNTRGTGVTNLAAGIIPNIIAFAPFVDHSGFIINVGGGGIVQDMNIYNFPGHSYLMINTNDSSSMNVKMTMFSGWNTAHDNYLGPWAAAGSIDSAGHGTLSPSYQQDAEYLPYHQFYCYSNTIGMYPGAGNQNVSGNLITANYIGLMTGSGNNTAHGEISDNTINHNLYAGMIIVNCASGELIQNNICVANPREIFWANAGLEIKNNRFSNDTITFSNSLAGGMNYFYGNSYQGKWGVDFIINGLVANTNAAYWNYSTSITNDTDGLSFPFRNGANLTNIVSTSIVTNSTFTYTPTTVTVGGSPFTFANTTPNYLEVFLTDTAAFSVTKNGAAIASSLTSDCYFTLQPSSVCVITYASTTPTMKTNAW